MDLVDLKARLVFELIPERAFPLRAGYRVEPTILQALQPLVSQRRLNVVELRHRSLVDLIKPFALCHTDHAVTIG